jgi:hypothetical protein
MSKIFGFCIKHKKKIYDHCPICENEINNTYEDEDEEYYDDEE